MLRSAKAAIASLRVGTRHEEGAFLDLRKSRVPTAWVVPSSRGCAVSPGCNIESSSRYQIRSDKVTWWCRDKANLHEDPYVPALVSGWVGARHLRARDDNFQLQVQCAKQKSVNGLEISTHRKKYERENKFRKCLPLLDRLGGENVSMISVNKGVVGVRRGAL